MRLLLVGKPTDNQLVGTVDEYVDLKLHFIYDNRKELHVFSPQRITRSVMGNLILYWRH